MNKLRGLDVAEAKCQAFNIYEEWRVLLLWPLLDRLKSRDERLNAELSRFHKDNAKLLSEAGKASAL
jgi:hypothetical protein